LIEIRGKITGKLEFWSQLGVKLKKFTAKPICKRRRTMGTQLIEIRGEIKELKV